MPNNYNILQSPAPAGQEDLRQQSPGADDVTTAEPLVSHAANTNVENDGRQQANDTFTITPAEIRPLRFAGAVTRRRDRAPGQAMEIIFSPYRNELAEEQKKEESGIADEENGKRNETAGQNAILLF